MTTSAGWYPDPAGSGYQRYFDGADWTEHYAPAAAPGRGGDSSKTVVWLVVHLGLALATLFLVVGVKANFETHDYGCKYHNECGNPTIDVATRIALGATALLFIVDLVLATSMMAKRLPASKVPVVCCIAQVIVAGIVFIVGVGTA